MVGYVRYDNQFSLSELVDRNLVLSVRDNVQLLKMLFLEIMLSPWSIYIIVFSIFGAFVFHLNRIKNIVAPRILFVLYTVDVCIDALL